MCIIILDLHRLKETEWNFFTCHSSPCYELETIPGEPNTFLSCSEDGTVRQFDLRSSINCSKEQCNEVSTFNKYIVFCHAYINFYNFCSYILISMY